MTEASKRNPHSLITRGLVALLCAGGLVLPSLPAYAEPAITPRGPVQPDPGSDRAEQSLQFVLRANPDVLAAIAALDAKPTITAGPEDATISRYGTRTSATFRVQATGARLRYAWQRRSTTDEAWKAIAGAISSSYKARASTWANGTSFRVVVTSPGGTVISAAATLTVLYPTATPAADAEAAFGLSGLTQGVDLSAYQFTPSAKVRAGAIATWAGIGGFALLRTASGSRPVKQAYTSLCSGTKVSTGNQPAAEDCAYAALADAGQAAGLKLGHYWFNGWISTIDATPGQLFSAGYTPTASAAQFVALLITDGNYTQTSTDPLVLDVEAGRAWTKSAGGKKYKLALRAWKPAEVTEFLATVKTLLTGAGYQANLYVYMGANVAARKSGGAFVWSDVAAIARLWVASWGTNNGRIPAAQPKVGPWAGHGGWSIWQYTCNARIDGDGVGGLDADIAKADAWTPR